MRAVEREGLYANADAADFCARILEEAYAAVAAQKRSITDEVSALEQLGRKVVLVPNEEPNLKITFPADLALAELILKTRRNEGL